MKLIIQIPCYNEEKTLASTLIDLPTKLEGIDLIEYLIIDDGSSDKTVAIAKEAGAHHIFSHTKNQGLAKAFMTGIEHALQLRADIIVNTDADNQYNANDIQKLVTPIVEGKADMVIGVRPIDEIEDFSFIKKVFQKLGSWVMRLVSHTQIEDAPSGFRAFSRRLAAQLNVFSEYTYTLETIIQAGQNDFAIASVPVRVNPSQRKSKLVKSIPYYIFRSLETMLRISVMYRPLRFFVTLASISFTAGLLLSLRFLAYYIFGNGLGKIQSLILATLLISSSLLLLLIGLVSDLISVNRKLLERNQTSIHRISEELSSIKKTLPLLPKCD